MAGKFGPITAETAAQIRNLTESELDMAITRILAARTLEEMNL